MREQVPDRGGGLLAVVADQLVFGVEIAVDRLVELHAPRVDLLEDERRGEQLRDRRGAEEGRRRRRLAALDAGQAVARGVAQARAVEDGDREPGDIGTPALLLDKGGDLSGDLARGTGGRWGKS